MSLKLPDVSCLSSLELTRLNELQGGHLRLFVSNHAPVSGDVLATYTAIEAAFGGYASQTVNDWGAAAAVGGVATVTAGVYTFTATGAGLPTTVYGYFYTDVNGALAHAELFATGGVTLSAAGHTVSVVPKRTRKSEF